MNFLLFFFFSSRRRHTRFDCDWSSDVCSSDLLHFAAEAAVAAVEEKISRELHGDGAGAASDAALDDISHRSAEQARKIDAPVLFEVLVLDGGDRAVQNFGALLVSHEDAAL